MRGQHREDRRRVALARRRLADGQADLALGAGEAGHRVEHEQHVAAALAEVLGDGGGHEAGAQAHQRRLVGGGAHHHRALHALLAQRVLDELAHLAAALADQADDATARPSVLRAICPISVDLPTPEPAKRPMRCPSPTVSSPSMSATPSESGCVDALALEGVGAVAVDGPLDQPSSGSGLPSMGSPRPSSTRPSSPSPTRMVSGRPVGMTSLSGPMPDELAQRHEHHLVALEADDLRRAPRRWPRRMRHTSPMRTPGTAALMTRPVSSVTRPAHPHESARLRAGRGSATGRWPSGGPHFTSFLASAGISTLRSISNWVRSGRR